ncbi:MAG: S8/S53 family peptidase [Actinomycetota bacterium]
MRVVRVLILLVVFALIAGACSITEDEETTTAAPETTTTAGTTPTPDDVDPSDGPIGMVILRGSDDEKALCGYDGDELLSPADFEDVWYVLNSHGIEVARYFNPDFPEPRELPGSLQVFVLTDPNPDPVEASRLLLADGIPASPHHLVMPADRWKFGPAFAPEEGAAGPDNYVQDAFDTDVHGAIAIVDTGSEPSPPGDWGSVWDPYLTSPVPVFTEPEPVGIAAEFVGHGVFAAGIVRRLLPGSDISIRSAMRVPSEDAGPVFSEFSVIGSIASAIGSELAEAEGGVVNLSLGTYTCEPDQIPLGLAAYLGQVAASEADVVFVAAAGNDGIDDPESPFWPAGFSDPDLITSRVDPWLQSLPDDHALKTGILALLDAQTIAPIVVGVGALDESWSNSVGATLWAPGTDIVSTYPGGDGFATWSGTSFAAPFVSALVAGCKGTGTYRDSLASLISKGPDITGPTC